MSYDSESIAPQNTIQYQKKKNVKYENRDQNSDLGNIFKISDQLKCCNFFSKKIIIITKPAFPAEQNS